MLIGISYDELHTNSANRIHHIYHLPGHLGVFCFIFCSLFPFLLYDSKLAVYAFVVQPDHSPIENRLNN